MEGDPLALMIKDLSVTLYTELPETQKPILSNSLSDLLQAPPTQILSSLKTLYTTLFDYKKSIKHFEYYSKFTENEGYQKEMQKLDSEIRNHIKHELQMKVFIDKLDEKLTNVKSSKDRKLFPYSSRKEVTEKLLVENKALKSSLNTKLNEIEDLRRLAGFSAEGEALALRERNEKDVQKILEISKENARTKVRCAQAKVELELMNNEYERQRGEFLELKSLWRDKEGNRVLNRSIERKEVVREVESKSARVSKTPTKVDNLVSQVRPYVKEMAKKGSKASQSTNKLERSPLVGVLKKELAKSKTKPKFQAYLNNKGKIN